MIASGLFLVGCLTALRRAEHFVEAEAKRIEEISVGRLNEVVEIENIEARFQESLAILIENVEKHQEHPLKRKRTMIEAFPIC